MGGILSGVGGLVGGILGGNSAPNTSSGPNVYQPGGTPTVDSQLQQLLTNNFNLVGSNNPYSTLTPQINSTFQSLYGNPNISGYNAAGANAGNAYNTVGNTGVNASGGISNAAMAGLPGAMSVLNMGLDPQNALYAQMLQRTNDQANVTNAQYGLTGQQAAGNVNQADTNFNIDWQNNQLQRALSGLSGYGNAIDSAGKGVTFGQTVGGQGAQDILQGGATPYGVGQTVGGNQETAIMQYLSQLYGPANASSGTIGDLSAYLNQGVNASEAGQKASLNDYYAQLQGAQAGASGGSQLGGLLGDGLSAALAFL